MNAVIAAVVLLLMASNQAGAQQPVPSGPEADLAAQVFGGLTLIGSVGAGAFHGWRKFMKPMLRAALRSLVQDAVNNGTTSGDPDTDEPRRLAGLTRTDVEAVVAEKMRVLHAEQAVYDANLRAHIESQIAPLRRDVENVEEAAANVLAGIHQVELSLANIEGWRTAHTPLGGKT